MRQLSEEQLISQNGHWGFYKALLTDANVSQLAYILYDFVVEVYSVTHLPWFQGDKGEVSLKVVAKEAPQSAKEGLLRVSLG